jgi:hypothetical protein
VTRGLGLALGCLLLAAAAPATASLVKALSLAELTQRADLIVVAVAKEHMSRPAKGGKLIVTDVALQVDDVLKGKAERGKSVVATVLGGAIGELGLHVPGEAQLPIGRRLIVFLYRSGGSELHVVGMAQGVMALHEANGQTTVMPGGDGAALVEPGRDGALRNVPAAVPQPAPFGQVVQRIKQLVASQK